MKKIFFKLIAAAVTCSLLGSMTAFAGEWKYDSIGYWYEKEDGNYIVSDWFMDDGKYYYFNGDGYMMTNAWIGNYYVGADGAMLTDTTTPDGYRVGIDGAWDANVSRELPRTPYADTLKEFRTKFQSTDSYILYCFIDFQKNDLIDHGTFYELKNKEIQSYFGDEHYWDYEGVVYSGNVYFYKDAQHDAGASLTFEKALDDAGIKRDGMSYQNGTYHWDLLSPDDKGYFTRYIPGQAT